MERKLDTAALFERLLEVYRDQFAVLFPAGLLVFLPAAALNGAAQAGDDVVWALALAGAAVGFLATFLYQGMVVEAVRDIQDGRRDFSVGDLLRSVLPVLGSVILVGVLASIGVLLGVLLLIVPGLVLLTRWAVAIPVVVVERPGRSTEAFGRSSRLVRGHGWRVFGVIVVVFLLQSLLSNIATAVITGVSDSFLGLGVATLLANALIAPLLGIVATLLYLDLRRLHGEPPVDAARLPAPNVREPTAEGAPRTFEAREDAR